MRTLQVAPKTTAEFSSVTHAAAVAPGEDAQHVGSRSRCSIRCDPGRKLMLPLALEEAIFFMQIHFICKNHSPSFDNRPRETRQADAPRRALSEPPRPFFRATNRSASRSERLRGRGRREERKPSLCEERNEGSGNEGRFFWRKNIYINAQCLGLRPGLQTLQY